MKRAIQRPVAAENTRERAPVADVFSDERSIADELRPPGPKIVHHDRAVPGALQRAQHVRADVARAAAHQ